MFYGQYEHTLDRKGRIIIPSKMRQVLNERFSDRFMATRGLEKCIFLFTPDGWNDVEDKIKTLPFMTGKNARAFTRLLFSGAVESSIDKQGRILLPVHLREYSGMVKDVIIAGVSTHVEIWAKEKWLEYVKKEAGLFEKTAEDLINFGI